ncbi:MAG: Spi family protease inhibitor, partial [Bacteroidales bacterium]|nr:Spi family protease inhibitor [Bacteroidales bacterium]
MRPIAIIISLLLIGQLVYAGPVEKATALKAGSHYLQMRGLMKADDSLTLHTVFTNENAGEQTTCFYVFNLANRGFVLVSADDRSTPILGYSMNG